MACTFLTASSMPRHPSAPECWLPASSPCRCARLAASWTIAPPPWRAWSPSSSCLTVVLIVQALLFADGGLTALGTNVTLMGIVGVWVAWGIFRLGRLLLPKRLSSVPLAAALGGFVSVPAAALAFVGLYAVGGAAPIPLGSLAATMGAWHVVIGLGEALITALVVGSLVSTRPDLVAGARDLVEADELEIRAVVAA